MASARIVEYLTFGALWQQHLHPYTARFPYNQFPCTAQQKDGFSELEAVIHLPNWPEESRTEGNRRSRGQLDILVHARERFTLVKPYRIEESKITVSYFKTETVTLRATPLSTVRYDYDQEIRPSHPLFHFHCCADNVPSPPPGQLESWRFQIQEPAYRNTFPFRVPTPHMSMCSVLIGLVAEHLDPQKFHDLWDAIRRHGWCPPASAKMDLWVRCQQNAAPIPLHSWDWYFWANG